jgi:hypothetical protein
MAQRKNKDRKENLNKYKNQRKQMNENQTLANSLPPVRNYPVWDQNANIVIKGFEWEAIQNGLAQIQLAQQAAQSVMSRNIVNGTISMGFEKLDPQTLQYVAMTAEEAAPHIKQFEEELNAFRVKVAEANKPKAEEVAASPILTEAGQPYTKTEEVSDVDAEFEKQLAAEDALPKEEAKVVPITDFINEPQTNA